MRARVRFGIEADARLQVEEGTDGAAVKRLNLRIFQIAAELALALCLEDEAVDVAAIPALGIPDISGVAALGGKARFEPFDQDHAGRHSAVFPCELTAGGSHGSFAPDRIGGVTRPFECARGYGTFGRSAGRGLVGHRAMLAVVHLRSRRGLHRHRAVIRMVHLAVVHFGCFLALRRALLGRQMTHRAMVHLAMVHLAVIHLGSGFLAPVPRMVLRHGRACGEHRRAQHQHRSHHASPLSGKGRTVTTCIIPACMW